MGQLSPSTFRCWDMDHLALSPPTLELRLKTEQSAYMHGWQVTHSRPP